MAGAGPHDLLVLHSNSNSIGTGSNEVRTVDFWCDCSSSASHTLCDSHNAAALSPFLMRTFALGEHLVFTEHCPLGSVSEFFASGRYRQAGSIPVESWFLMLLEALGCLHDAGKVHGNITHETVFVADGGRSIRIHERSYRPSFGSLSNDPSHDIASAAALIAWVADRLGISLSTPFSRAIDSLSRGASRPPPASECFVRLNSVHRGSFYRPSVSFPPDDRLETIGECPHPRMHTPSRRSAVPSLAVVKLPRYGSVGHGEGHSVINEIEIIQSLRPRHPNIVRYLAYTRTQLYMELCVNGSLAALRPYALDPVPTISVRSWARQLASALQYLHRANYSHNDLCPEKILVDPDPTSSSGRILLKISGFSLASPMTAAEPSGRYHLPEFDDYEDYGYPSPGREYTRPEVDGAKIDMFHFGLVLWFINDLALGSRQGGMGGGAVPSLGNGYTSYVEYLDFEGMMLKPMMESCLGHWSRRPSAGGVVRSLAPTSN